MLDRIRITFRVEWRKRKARCIPLERKTIDISNIFENNLQKKSREKAMARHDTVMRLLIRRYVTAEQRKRDQFGITEDDVMEIRQDISTLRYELIDILRQNGMRTPMLEKQDAASKFTNYLCLYWLHYCMKFIKKFIRKDQIKFQLFNIYRVCCTINDSRFYLFYMCQARVRNLLLGISTRIKKIIDFILITAIRRKIFN